MTLTENILSKVLKRIKPSEKGVPACVTETLGSIQHNLDSRKINARVMLGGSYAKGTHLAGDFDVDIFVRFDKKNFDSEQI